MYFKTAHVAGLRLFYREAGDPSKPTIVLLHGFPSSSYEFHDLIPRLADRFHVIAPDYPGMGFSDAPAPTVLRPTFDDVAIAIDAFIAQRAPGPVILYMHDFGGPIGMRIATAHPERITGLIFQNTTISLEGWNSARLKVYERIGGLKPQTSWPRPSNWPPRAATCFFTRRARAGPTPWIRTIGRSTPMRSRSRRIGSSCRGC